MTYNPLHPNCGPFNRLTEPANEVDAICYRHDLEYSAISSSGQGNPYLYPNEADDKFIRDMRNRGFIGRLYSLPFVLKRALIPWRLGPIDNMPNLKRIRQNQSRLRPKPAPKTRRISVPAAMSSVSYGGSSASSPSTVKNVENVVGSMELDKVSTFVPSAADDTCFPLLALEARNRQYVRWNRLHFEYISTVGTSAVGEVAMAWIADPNRPRPTSFEEVMAIPGSVTGPLWAPLQLTVESRQLRRRKKYILTTMAAGESHLYLPGYLVYYAQAAADPGRIRAHYHVTLYDKTPNPLATDSLRRTPNGAGFLATDSNVATGTAATAGRFCDLPNETAIVRSPYLDVAIDAQGTNTLRLISPALLRITLFHAMTKDVVAGESEISVIYSIDGGTSWNALADRPSGGFLVREYYENAASSTAVMGNTFYAYVDPPVDGMLLTYDARVSAGAATFLYGSMTVEIVSNS